MKRLFCVLLLGVAVAPMALADTQTDMLAEKLNRLEQDVVLLQRQTYQSPTVTSATGDAPSLDGLYTQLTEQQNMIRDLTAQVEKLSFELEKQKEQLTKMNADVDMRFKLQAADAAVTTGAAPTTNPRDDTAAYDAAYALLKKGDFPAAENAFQSFMKDYPNSKLVGNANYWLGETYYARGQFEQAVGIFADGFTKYKDNSKAADNLLKLGMSMAKLNKNTEACTAFSSLPVEFPNAADSLKNRAVAEAKKLSCAQ